jgi:hypothetical protein
LINDHINGINTPIVYKNLFNKLTPWGCGWVLYLSHSRPNLNNLIVDADKKIIYCSYLEQFL